MVKNKKKSNRNRSARYGKGRTTVYKLPSPFNRVNDDVTVIKGRGVLTMTAGEFYTSGSLMLTPRLISGTQTLNTLVPSLHGLSSVYERFIVLNMTVKVIPTLPLTTGSVLAVGYEPLMDADTPNPSALADVLISRHHTSTNQMTSTTFSFRPMQYKNDWCNCALSAGSANNDVYNGYVQYYGSPGSGVLTGYLDISFDIAFCGLHYAA